MGIVSTIRRNSLFSFFSSAIRLLSNLLLFVGIARFYGVETFGQFTTAHTFLTVFFLLADFGFDLLITTEIARARGRSREYVERFMPLKAAFAVTAFLLMTTIALLSDFSAETRIFMIVLSSGIVANAVSSFCYAVFKGHEDLSQEFRVSLIQNSVLLAALAVLGFLRVPPVFIALAFVGSRFVGLAVIMPRMFRALGMETLSFRFSEWPRILREGLPFGVQLIFGTLYFQLETILLAYFKGDKAVGIYQSAVRLMYGIFIIPEVLGNAFIPLLSRLHEEDRERWSRVAMVLQKTLMYSSLPVGIIFYVYAADLIDLVYGSAEFAGAVPLLKIFAFIIVIRFAVETSAMVLTVSRAQVWRMRIVIFLTFFNVVCNVLAIPAYGVQGAAVVSLVTNIVAGLLYVVTAHAREFRVWYMLGKRQLLTCASVAALVFLLTLLDVRSLLVGVPVILAGCLAVFYFIGYSPEERAVVFSLPGDLSVTRSVGS